MANSPEEAFQLYKQWNLVEEGVKDHLSKHPSPSHLQEEWSSVAYEKKRATRLIPIKFTLWLSKRGIFMTAVDMLFQFINDLDPK
ncbi:hypothetical protein GDO81_013670 [Engystomops pustulosus]|uniref:Uncharacterized protein n=1 Tax=Engystomops pustulosus TaxID=76066 RepID=A0AAV7B4L0_ENGPU|nr:hypothetical protein GDO81_013670 [Engystomops pustulosus]